MSWKDPNSPWAKRARDYQWLNTAYWIILAVFAIGCGIATFWLMPPFLSPIDNPFDWFIFLALAGLLCFATLAVWMYRSARKYKRVIRDVPTLDGAVCPWCWRAMTRSRHEVPGAAAHAYCYHCKCKHTLEDLQRYWVWMVLEMLTAGRWYVEHHPRRDTWFGRWRRRQVKDKPWYRELAAGCVFPAVYFFSIWWFFGLSMLAFAIPLLFFILAVSIFPFRDWFLREGTTRHCVQCDYQVIPSPDAQQQQRCPECGSDWSHPGAIITGRHKPKAPAHNLRTGAAVALFVIALAMLLTAATGWTSRIAPTRLLVSQVTTGSGFLFTEWAALAARDLTHEQRLNLARGLLQRRESRSTLENHANQWFYDQIAADSLPAEIIDDYWTGIIKARLLGPDTAVRGEQISIGLENINRYQPPLAAATAPAVFFGGFWIGDESNACCRAEKVMSIISFGSRIISYGMSDMALDGGLKVTITPDRPGSLHIRARYWIAGIPAGRGSMIQEIDWNEDGTPNFPPGTTWIYEHLLEHTIEVTEPQP